MRLAMDPSLANEIRICRCGFDRGILEVVHAGETGTGHSIVWCQEKVVTKHSLAEYASHLCTLTSPKTDGDNKGHMYMYVREE